VFELFEFAARITHNSTNFFGGNPRNMGFFALGVNHTTASVDLREKVAFSPERLSVALHDACGACQLESLVILSTCNRTELYAMTEQPALLLDWLAQFNGLGRDDLLQHVYQFDNEQAITHLIRVASGLDSMVLGEPQIFGQVKNALQHAKQTGTLSNGLNRIFEHVFYAAKKVRTETAVGEQAVSMGYAVVQLAQQVFSRLSQSTALIVAAGEMNTLVARHLVEQGIGRLLICNRGIERAAVLADELSSQVPVEIVPFEQLAEVLPRADIVSSCTGSLHQVIAASEVRLALKKRRYKPMLMVDLAVPRDIDQAVRKLDDVYLYDVDHLQTVIEGNLAQRRQAALEAEVMVSQLSAQFIRQQRSEQATPYIVAYRQYIQQLKTVELEKARQMIQQGQDSTEVLERMANALAAKLAHAPSQLIRQAALHENPEILAWTLEELLDKQDIAAFSAEKSK
jgi:glutamyl-tRNA reductase